METILSYFDTIISLVLPKDTEVRRIEKMSPETFLASIATAEIIFGVPCHTIFAYRDPLMKVAMWEIKYHHNKAITRTIAQILSDHILAELGEDISSRHDHFLLVPIPRSAESVREYGYDQCKEIAKYATAHLDKNAFTLQTNALTRVRETQRQSTIKNRRERLANMHENFIASPQSIADKHIILFDDVITTGATLSAAAKALQKAGAKSVTCFAIAH